MNTLKLLFLCFIESADFKVSTHGNWKVREGDKECVKLTHAGEHDTCTGFSIAPESHVPFILLMFCCPM